MFSMVIVFLELRSFSPCIIAKKKENGKQERDEMAIINATKLRYVDNILSYVVMLRRHFAGSALPRLSRRARVSAVFRRGRPGCSVSTDYDRFRRSSLPLRGENVSQFRHQADE